MAPFGPQFPHMKGEGMEVTILRRILEGKNFTCLPGRGVQEGHATVPGTHVLGGHAVLGPTWI